MPDLNFRYITCVAVAGSVYWPSNPGESILYIQAIAAESRVEKRDAGVVRGCAGAGRRINR